ncbi:t-SNARE [Thelephora terrestris]|uniref:t-SNARE n=1 Tax=Thelephora terrestris TaxID=56493 RepID=A0A9P6H765_9AGAM|nr:t-SNARE [Thelephora terrestris]
MAMDRLAALRAQRQPQDSYELNPTQQTTDYANNQSSNYGNDAGNGSSDNFFDEVSNVQGLINQFNSDVARITELQGRSLNVVDESSQNLAQLDDQVAQTRDLGNQIKRRIEALKKQPVPRGQEARKNQVNVVAKQFMTALQNYTQVEKDYRQKQRARVERQFKIVKPDATPEEVAAVVDNTDGAGGQVFSQALSSSTRYGQSRTAYKEVQDRQEDIKKIERTLEELAQLFNDMSVLVAQQDESIDYIQNTAHDIEQDASKGVDHTDKAVVSARAARKKRWICFGLFVLLLAIVAAIVAGIVVTNNNKK